MDETKMTAFHGSPRATIDVGVFQFLAKKWIGKTAHNADPIKAIKVAHSVKTLISSADTLSDMVLALTLFQKKEYKWGLSILIIDYLPMWQVLFHGIFSNAWRNLNDIKEKALAILFLLCAPFATPLFKLRLLWGYRDKDDETFEFNHQNERVSDLISSTVESPFQLVLMLVMVLHGKLPMPWTDNTSLQDSSGNEYDLGSIPSLVSLTMSFISILVSSLDTAECGSWKDRVVFGSYSLANGLFRAGSFIILLSYFESFTLYGMFPLLALASFMATLRLEPWRRKNLSVLTTVLTGIFLPIAVSEEPQRAQYPEKAKINKEPHSDNRRLIAAKISLMTLPIIWSFDLSLFLVLLFNEQFKLPCSVIDSLGLHYAKMFAIKLLFTFILPSGILSLFSAGLLQIKISSQKLTASIGLLSILVIVSASFGAVNVRKECLWCDEIFSPIQGIFPNSTLGNTNITDYCSLKKTSSSIRRIRPVFQCAPIGDAGPYTKKFNHFCKPNDKMASKNLNDAKKECSNDPSCRMFFESCGKVSYYRCSDSASVILSVCSATLYRKETDATITVTRSGLDPFPAPCCFVTGFVSGKSEYVGKAIDEEQCAQMVTEEKPLATGASYRKVDRFCWAGYGGSIKDCSICRACVFKLN